MLKPVDDVPATIHVGENFTAKDVREFMRKSLDAAEISYPDKSASNVANAARRYINRHGLSGKVCVNIRGGKAYLRRISQLR